MWSSPSQRSPMPVAMLLISTAGRSWSGSVPTPWFQQLSNAGYGVVVCECEDLDSGRGCGLHKLERLKHSVRAAAVGVEIHARRMWRHDGRAYR